MVLLDSSFLIDILRNRRPAVTLFDTLEQNEPHLVVASPTVMELWRGTLRSQLSEREKSKVESLLSSLEVIPFDEKEAKRTAEVEAEMEMRGVHCGVEDLMIAGTALTHGETVVAR